ncbi:MAG TPA: HD domain-containing phosphohydrolase [Gemmatimonadaceae bacterium]|nr:HD domain-containing phosphohydrolase [Gemmatimonadaceae bacterium]
MSAPMQFLNSLAQSLATLSLYTGTHPARARAIDSSYRALVELQREEAAPLFSFLQNDVIYGQVPLHEMKDWPWATRLAEAGIQRVEFVQKVSREDYALFLDELLARLAPGGGESVVSSRQTSIKYGALGLRGDDGSGGSGNGVVGAGGVGGAGAGGAGSVAAEAAMKYLLGEEAETVEWVHDQVTAGKPLPITEAEAVVRSLAIAMRCDSVLVVPLIRLKAADQHAVFHSINVSVLTMALASYLGLADRDVHELGMAGLLHDVGMARVPKEILLKPDPLTAAESAIVWQHPLEGARLLLGSRQPMELAATVAYEHHLRPDGTGYPTLRYTREPHMASKLVRVCDVYNALRSERHHRGAWTPEDALRYIDEHSGTEFDPELGRAFTAMMRGMGREDKVLAMQESGA